MSTTTETPPVDHEVRLVRWPGDADRLESARREGAPRLILVGEHLSPPVVSDVLEDWIRLPASPEDIDWRVSVLAERAAASAPTLRPTLDADGLLGFDDRIVPLSPTAHVLARVLVDRFRRVVTRELLAQAAWPGCDPGLNALDVHLGRLRRRVHDVGLTVQTVRQRGYLLDVAS